MNKHDANKYLSQEIEESALRLKAAKFGHTIDEIAPSYLNTFYLPTKNLQIVNSGTKRYSSSLTSPCSILKPA